LTTVLFFEFGVTIVLDLTSFGKRSMLSLRPARPVLPFVDGRDVLDVDDLDIGIAQNF
jgi:hypothetical protein